MYQVRPRVLFHPAGHLIGLTKGATETDTAKELAAIYLKSAHYPPPKAFLLLCDLYLLLFLIPGFSPAGRRGQLISEGISRRFSVPPPPLAAVFTLFGSEADRRSSERCRCLLVRSRFDPPLIPSSATQLLIFDLCQGHNLPVELPHAEAG